jgi:calcium/calmodulin-dependent protein kinase (CaM kinase) II
MSSNTAAELLALNQRLLDAIVQGDWATYAELCDPSLTAFEPEALGHLVVGLDFHHYYFKLERSGNAGARQVTMASPHVRVMGDAAVLCYVRLNQSLDASGSPVTAGVEETRVWERKNGAWKHVHFHRAPLH